MRFHDSIYDLKFFNYTAEQISAERERLVQNMVGKAIENAIQKIETPATSILLGAQKDEVVRLVEESALKNMKSLRELDKKYFRVPPHVLLVPDFHLEHQYTALDEEKKNAQLKQLKVLFRENLITLAKLEAEAKHYESVVKIVQQETNMQKKVYEDCASINAYKLAKFATRVATIPN
ncbi:uncharacterized protein LOC117582287 [Drosophila guanche]|uniref:Protein MIS12 homolog n=1 Tax=Drosophila guanche TaxID=7266 RepID=A0A3B0JW62_DROGU|nr:uncharacterized protein LOC117582287 [Drosophila guanche]SPP79730.1 Hypothetical predicted protein [Drosophila guanche]